MKPSSDIAMSAITVCGLVVGEEEVVWLVMGGMFGAPPGRYIGQVAEMRQDGGRMGTPVHRTALVGRGAERAALARALDGPGRLVTLAGPGGAGKTRLAADAAGASSSSREVVWVELAAVREPVLVVAALVEATGVMADGVAGPERSLVAGLAER